MRRAICICSLALAHQFFLLFMGKREWPRERETAPLPLLLSTLTFLLFLRFSPLQPEERERERERAARCSVLSSFCFFLFLPPLRVSLLGRLKKQQPAREMSRSRRQSSCGASAAASAAALALLSLLLAPSIFLLAAAQAPPPTPPFWSYAVKLSTGEVQVRKNRERERERDGGERANKTVFSFSVLSREAVGLPFFFVDVSSLSFSLSLFLPPPPPPPPPFQKTTPLKKKIVWPLVPGTAPADYLVEACADGPACQARSPAAAAAAAAGSGSNPAAAAAAAPPCPACSGELSLVAPAPSSPFTFYRVSLVVAGSEAAAAPPAYPLADAGNAAENLFVAPAPRGSDGGASCGSWASPCASVQPALSKLSADPAAPVASVWVAPGYYSGASNGDLSFGGKKGIVRSLAGKEVTLLDGEWQRRLFIFSSFESPQSMIMGKRERGGVWF